LLQIHALSDTSGSTKATYSLQTSLIKTHKPSSFASFSNARLRSLQFGENEWVDWEEDEIMGPNVESRETLLELAKMTNNAYLEPNETGWYELNGTWNIVRVFSSLLTLRILTNYYVIYSLILSDGKWRVMRFVATSLPHPTTQQSSFRSKALLQICSAEVGLRLNKTNLTTICYSAVAVRALVGHGPLYVTVIEVVGNVTRIAWKKHSSMTVYSSQLALFVFSPLISLTNTLLIDAL